MTTKARIIATIPEKLAGDHCFSPRTHVKIDKHRDPNVGLIQTAASKVMAVCGIQRIPKLSTH